MSICDSLFNLNTDLFKRFAKNLKNLHIRNDRDNYNSSSESKIDDWARPDIFVLYSEFLILGMQLLIRITEIRQVCIGIACK